jgi:hypothetical protein
MRPALPLFHVNRMMALLRFDGLLSQHGKEVQVIDWPGLKAAADFGPLYLHAADSGWPFSFSSITLPSSFGDDEGALVIKGRILIGPMHDQAGRWFVEGCFLDRPLHAGRLYDDLSDLEAASLSAD